MDTSLRKISFMVLFLFLLGFSSFSEEPKNIVQNYVDIYKNLPYCDIEYLVFNKSATFSEMEGQYIDTLKNPASFEIFKGKIIGNFEKLQVTELQDTEFITYVHYKKAIEREYIQEIGFYEGESVVPHEQTKLEDVVYDYIPSTNAWIIDKNVKKFRELIVYNPLNYFIAYGKVMDTNKEFACNYLDALALECEDISSTIEGTIQNIIVKKGKFKVSLRIDNENFQMNRMNIEVKFSDEKEVKLDYEYMEYQTINGKKFPAKIKKTNFDNGTLKGEEIVIFGKISVNDPLEINFSEDSIKHGAIVTDRRINYEYKKGYPEVSQ